MSLNISRQHIVRRKSHFKVRPGLDFINCHIIQLALQKKFIIFLCLKISFFHHPKVFILVKLPV